MKETYIVLIPLNDNREARKQCELIEATEMNFHGVKPTALAVAKRIGVDIIGVDVLIEVEPITDFMDRVNNQDFDSDAYFISYAFGYSN